MKFVIFLYTASVAQNSYSWEPDGENYDLESAYDDWEPASTTSFPTTADLTTVRVIHCGFSKKIAKISEKKNSKKKFPIKKFRKKIPTKNC